MTLNLKNLLNPKVKGSKMGEFQELRPIEGLQISAVSADLYGDGRDDLTLFFFEEGANFWSVGAYLNRPPRGNIYLGYDILSGPIENQFLTFSYNYTMSPKWISSFVNQVDLKQNNNVGQSIFLTRIGADFLLSFGFRVDSNKDNVGVSLGIQPRIAPDIQLGKVRGAHIPPSTVAPFE